jgi:hypothetical protein
MTNARRPRLTMIVLAIAIGGAGLTTATWLVRSMLQADQDWQLSGLIKLGNYPTPTPAFVDMVAQYDFACFSYGAWDTPAMQQAAKDIRRQNLDIHLGTYVHAFTAPQWCRVAAERGQNDWLAKWWIATSPYLVRTADGDTAAIWMNNYDWNVTIPEARAAAIGQLRDYVRATGITWAMLDFMSVPLESFQIPGYPIRNPDFDGDGIACKDDADEKQLLKESWYAYVRELRAALGPDFLLIPNGTLALYDARFSMLVDGAYVEGFPMWFYGSGTQPNYTNALDPAFGPQALPNLCTPGRWARTPGFVMIEDRWQQGSYGALAALWPGCVEMRRSHDDVVYPPLPLNLLNLGAPLAPAYPGWGRLFEHGTVSVESAGGRLFHSIERTEP